MYIQRNGIFSQLNNIQGYAYSWGYNSNYQTGNGNTTNVQVPTKVGTAIWKKVVAGFYASFGIKTDGTLWTVGNNLHYNTGRGTATSNTTALTQIGTDTDWIDVVAGQYWAMGLKSNGKIYTWGESQYYNTGQNTTTDVQNPTQLGTDTDWVEIAAGYAAGFARKRNNSIWSWGKSANYNTGQGTLTNITVPTQMGTATDFIKISAGIYGFTILKTNGSIYNCGYNANYALGQNNTTDVQALTRVGTDNDWVDVCHNGFDWGMGIKQNGKLYSWGHSNAYQTGQNTTTDVRVPTQLGSATDWLGSQLGGGYDWGAIIKPNGTLWTWGDSSEYRTGQNTTSNKTVPTQIGSATDWLYVTHVPCAPLGWALKAS